MKYIYSEIKGKKHQHFLIHQVMRHGGATWTEAKASENNQSCAVSATRLARPVPRQGHMESLQGEWHGETKCLPNPLRTAGRKWNLSSEARSIRLASVDCLQLKATKTLWAQEKLLSPHQLPREFEWRALPVIRDDQR